MERSYKWTRRTVSKGGRGTFRARRRLGGRVGSGISLAKLRQKKINTELVDMKKQN